MFGHDNHVVDGATEIIQEAARQIVARYPETSADVALRFANEQFKALNLDPTREEPITVAAIVNLADQVERQSDEDDVRIRDDLKQLIFNGLERKPEGLHYVDLAAAFKDATRTPLSICQKQLSDVLVELTKERYIVVRGEGQSHPVYARNINFHKWVSAMKSGDNGTGSVTNTTTTYNVSGQGARVNVHSTDSSTNIVGNGAKVDVQGNLADLRKVIDTAPELSDDERKSALQVVEAVEAEFQKDSPVKAVVTALLNGLPKVAAVATIANAIHTWFL